jgi:hypothetical protein
MTTAMYTCPADGCNEGPLPRESIAGHYAGTRDDAHRGGWEKAKLLLEEQGSETQFEQSSETKPPEQSPETEPPKQSSEQSSSEATSGGTKLEFPENSSDDLDKPDPGCPDCGAEDFYGATQVLHSGDWAPEIVQELRTHDRVCVDCGEIYG